MADRFEPVAGQGCSAVVTGAASGIGRATARRLGRRGVRLVLADVDSAGAAAAEEIAARGAEAEFVRADVGDAADCRRLVGRAETLYGRIDVLVNSAGIVCRADVLTTTEAEWDEVMRVNVKSVFLLSRAVLPEMSARGAGSIVNIASGWGLAAGARAAAYCASKAAVVQLTRAMAIDHARQGIRVNCVCPGDTDTPMLDAEAAATGLSREDFVRKGADRPVERIGTPDEIAEAALYLALDAGPFVTGAALVIDGGGLLG